MESLGETFASVPDPRAGNARHDLAEILVIAFAATLCGAETCCDMALFGRAKEPLLREFLALPHGIPSHDTFSRVFRFLDPAAFEMAFRRFTAAFAERLSGRTGLAGTVVAIDGKSLAGACEAGARATPLHLVTAWAADQRLVLAQRRAPGRSEVTAALEVVGMLDLLGATVTADDRARSRKDNAAENLAILRRLALNLLRTDPDKSSLRGKIKKAGWHDQYLLNLLAQMRSSRTGEGQG